jgi:hypothetical protein
VAEVRNVDVGDADGRRDEHAEEGERENVAQKRVHDDVKRSDGPKQGRVRRAQGWPAPRERRGHGDGEEQGVDESAGGQQAGHCWPGRWLQRGTHDVCRGAGARRPRPKAVAQNKR